MNTPKNFKIQFDFIALRIKLKVSLTINRVFFPRRKFKVVKLIRTGCETVEVATWLPNSFTLPERSNDQNIRNESLKKNESFRARSHSRVLDNYPFVHPVQRSRPSLKTSFGDVDRTQILRWNLCYFDEVHRNQSPMQTLILCFCLLQMTTMNAYGVFSWIDACCFSPEGQRKSLECQGGGD